MVKIDKKSFIKGLSNPNEISENNYKSFLKLSKDYPFFNSVHLINLFISKKLESEVGEIEPMSTMKGTFSIFL